MNRDSTISNADPKDYDYLFKVVLVGDPGVGKSCLLVRFADDEFNENYYSTIGVDFRFKTLCIDNKNVKLQIWDTAGQEKFRCLTNAYYRDSSAILFVFDTSNPQSLDSIHEWYNDTTQFVDTEPEFFLIGTKTDIAVETDIKARAEQVAEEKKMHLFFVSAKANSNVLETFVDMTRELVKKGNSKKDKKVINVGDPAVFYYPTASMYVYSAFEVVILYNNSDR